MRGGITSMLPPSSVRENAATQPGRAIGAASCTTYSMSWGWGNSGKETNGSTK